MSERSAAILCRRSQGPLPGEEESAENVLKPACSSNGSGSENLLSAPSSPSLYRKTPLEIDRLNRLVSSDIPPCTGPRSLFFFLKDTPRIDRRARLDSYRPYRGVVVIPDGCYSSGELDRIGTTVLKLNPFVGVPVTRFGWNQWVEGDIYSFRGPEYWPGNHSIYLSHQPTTGPLVPRIEGTLAELVHAMGEAMYTTRFREDPDWDEVYLRALGFRNYEIIHNQNYIENAGDGSIGYPWHAAENAFASGIYAYFFNADLFAAFIRNERTPEVMRAFGKLVWTYMRDLVFRGAVFTFDGVDPFGDESFSSALKRLPEKRECLIDLFSNDPKALARWAGARRLNNDPIPEAAPALQIARGDSDSMTAETALRALQQILPR